MKQIKFIVVILTLMSQLGQNSKISSNLEQLVLKKISDLITKFHSLLLPKANNSGVYRDLSEEQEYLLTTIEADTLLHSVLAGSLAVDSCLTNIVKHEKTQIDLISRTFSTTFQSFKRLEKDIHTANNKNQIQSFEIFSTEFQKYIKQIEEWMDNGSKKETRQLGKEEDKGVSDLDQNSLVIDLNMENIKLKEQLVEAEKQQVSLELKIMKMIQNANSGDGQQMKGQIQNYKQTIKRMREEKSELMNELERMEEEIRILSKFNDRNANYLLEELEYEVECLKEQKRHDQRLFSEIQMKMDMMCLSRNRNKMSIDGSIRSDYLPPHYAQSSRSRIREQFQRPSSHLKKSKMMRKSTVFEYEGGDKQQKKSFHLPLDRASLKVGKQFNKESYNESFMPRYSPRDTKVGKKVQFYRNSGPEQKGLSRIKTTYL